VNPSQEYQQRLTERRTRVDKQEQRHIQLGNIRLAIGIAAAFVAWKIFAQHAWHLAWLAAPVALFIPLAVLHERVITARTLARRAVRFYERGLARIEDRWAGTGETGERFRDTAHPYADDLDLFGPASLFELLSVARTRGGEAALAHWLQHPAPTEEIAARQHAVQELRTHLDLREAVYVMAEDARDAVHTEALIAWAESPQVMPKQVRWVAFVLSLLVLASALALPKALLICLVAVAGFGLWLRPRVLSVITHVDDAVHDLELLSGLLARMEAAAFESPKLLALQQELSAHGKTASAQIARLHRLAEWIDSRDNVVVRAVGPPLLYGTHLAFAVEKWREEAGPLVRHWITALSEFEALQSLASYAYEHPTDPFPELLAEQRLEGDQLGHPLLPDARCIRNSIELHPNRALLVVSGSNMSGKSTYLRTIGVNVVLAMAGAPVRARKLSLGPLQVGASIRVTDSLQGGSSRFFAEITRLRKVVDLAAAQPPVLFLLDELLNGTNSQDRRIGAEGILRELLQRGAIGLVTTHDLALTAIADTLAPKATNVHFEDTLTDGELHFDYTVQPGVVRKSNALELMRSIGLDV
jgi:hypothetical protein